MTARNPYRATLPRRRPSIWPAVALLALFLMFGVLLPVLVVAIERGWL